LAIFVGTFGNVAVETHMRIFGMPSRPTRRQK
jgi:hypothetical protein